MELSIDSGSWRLLGTHVNSLCPVWPGNRCRTELPVPDAGGRKSSATRLSSSLPASTFPESGTSFENGKKMGERERRKKKRIYT